jgi:hypothetical protein
MADKTLWTVSGCVQVFDYLTEWDFSGFIHGPKGSSGAPGPNKNRPLQNIEVRIQASRKDKGGFRTWDTVRTNSRGNFTYRGRQQTKTHRIRIRIRYNDNDLAVLDPRGVDQMRTRWITVYEDGQKRRATTRNIGALTFNKRSRHKELGKEENQIQGIFWFAAHRLIRRLQQEDPWLAFKGKVHITWPARLFTGASFAQNLLKNRTAHIHRGVSDGHKILTLFHEMMHLWNYDHNKGTSNWLASIASFRHGLDFATDGEQENPNIAFHEGFAEFAGWELWRTLFRIKRVKPYTRYFLKQHQEVTTGAEAEQNWLGVMSGLLLLTDPDLYRYTFGPADSPGSSYPKTIPPSSGCPVPPAMRVWDVMKVFQANPRAGWKTDWQVGGRKNGLYKFYDRTKDISPSLDAATVRLLRDLLDPESTREPQSRCRRR